MSLLRSFAIGLRSLFRRDKDSCELDQELDDFMEMAVEEKMCRGMTRKEALRAVRLEQGSRDVTREAVHAARWESFLETCSQDLRIGFRRLWKSPGFTAVAVLTLALGIGATTAIFTLIDAVMLESLPVENPKQLYRLGDNNNCCSMTGTQNGGSFVLYSYPLYEQLRDHTPEFEQLAGFSSYLDDLSVRGPRDSAAKAYQGEFVSGNYFQMLGIQPSAGRLLTPGDDSPTSPRMAVMSYRTWQQSFALDASVVGSVLNIDGAAYTVAGIADPQFYGETLRSDPPDFWLPLAGEPEQWRLQSGNVEWLCLVGRLKDGIEPDSLQARLTVELQQWLGSHRDVIPQRDWGEIPRQHIRLTLAARGVEQMQTQYSLALRLLATLSALLLLIACANIANLLLARGSDHRSKIAVQLALGGTRFRLIRQLITESVILAVAGGVAGLYTAYLGTHALLLLAFRGAHYIPISARPSVPVLGFATLLSLATGLVFGIAPAWMASRSSPVDALRGAGRAIGGSSSKVQKSLIVVQVALSIVLLIGAGLLTKSLRNLEGQQFGFVTHGRLIVSLISPQAAGYSEAKLPGLYRRLEDAIPRIPGVLTGSLSTYSPLEGNNWSEYVVIQGKPPDFSGMAPSWLRVGPHYFQTIGTRLLEGRLIDERDGPGAPRVAVVNDAFARRYFPKENAIGHSFGMSDLGHSGDYEIVGIVENAKYQDTRGPAYPTFFLPLLQVRTGEPLRGWVSSIELQVAGRPENLEPAVHRAIAEVDPNLTVLRMVSFDEQVARNFNQERLIARLAELFGVLALILACVGLYSVTAYAVARRTSEIGIRIAVGAGRTSILTWVMRSAMSQVIWGLAIGIPVTLAGGRLLADQLYGVRNYDPSVIGLAAAVLIACALVAAAVPARRASGVDPLAALRYE
jgi:macrolide transport system ATP-binding/permease protein